MEKKKKLRSVLRYPGSKWKIASRLTKLIPEHRSYVEPYFGSGAVFFTKEPSAIETINDIDGDVINLFSCIRNDPEKLGRMVLTTPYARKTYEKQFSMNENMFSDPYDKACSFLIKCWQGYGYRPCAKSGWKNDVKGRERMYALWNWYRLPEWIIDITERLRKVQIECRPALEVIRRFNGEKVFMYIDPPYLLDTRCRTQYAHEMSDNDHKELLFELTKTKAKVMISGYASEMYDDMLKGWTRKEFSAQAENGQNRTEIVWMNYKLPKSGQLTLF